MISVNDIKQELQSIGDVPNIKDPNYCIQLDDFIGKYKNDSRKGVLTLVEKANKKIGLYNDEVLRTNKLLMFEKQYNDYNYICGIDEVGRGPLAGPVVAGAVILPKDCQLLHVNDSKQLSAKKREELYDLIKKEAVSVATARVEHDEIDELNILQATYKAMRLAISKLNHTPDLLLNDAVKIPEVDIKQVSIIKGDSLSLSIGAASIVAKVERDRLMEDYDKLYPGYDFASNKGYGSAKHIEALLQKGPCPIHRLTFVKSVLEHSKK